MTLRVRSVTGAADLQALAGVWSEVTEQGAQPTPFLSHGWFECCRTAGGDRPLEVLVVEDSVAPVALIPLQRWTGRARGLPARYLGLLDCPDSPFGDIVLAGPGQPVVRSVLDHLARHSDWDILELRRLTASSAMLKAFEAELPGRLPWRRAGADQSPYLAIEGTWQAFWTSRSQRFKKTIRNVHNRLARLGSITVEEHRVVAPDGSLFEDLIDLTSRSWKADRGVAIATMPRMREFFAQLTRLASDRGWLSLWFLRLDGRPIAMEYQLQSHGTAHALRADYDLAYAASSPGSSLNFAIARALFERGDIREYDMGPGLKDYKMRWATGCHETVDLQVYRGSVYSRLLHSLEIVVIPAARRAMGLLR